MASTSGSWDLSVGLCVPPPNEKKISSCILRINLFAVQFAFPICLAHASLLQTNDEHAKKFILHEMVARTLKNLYFVRLREKRPVDDEALRSCTAAYLNDAFSDDEAGKKFWQEKVWDKLQVDYEYVFPL